MLVFLLPHILLTVFLLLICLEDSIKLLFSSQPDYHHLRVFGCLCYASNSSTSRHKLGARAHHCVSFGYPYGIKGCKAFDIENETVFTSRNVIFQESMFPFQDSHSQKDPFALSCTCPDTHDSLVLPHQMLDLNYMTLSSQDPSIISPPSLTSSSPQNTSLPK